MLFITIFMLFLSAEMLRCIYMYIYNIYLRHNKYTYTLDISETIYAFTIRLHLQCIRSAHNSIYILITFNCNLLIEISTNILSLDLRVRCAIESKRERGWTIFQRKVWGPIYALICTNALAKLNNKHICKTGLKDVALYSLWWLGLVNVSMQVLIFFWYFSKARRVLNVSIIASGVSQWRRMCHSTIKKTWKFLVM